MFSSVEPAQGLAASSPPPATTPPNALAAGMLKPKAALVTTMPDLSGPANAAAGPVTPAPDMVASAARGPRVGRSLLVIGILIVLGGVSLVALGMYRSSIQKNTLALELAPAIPVAPNVTATPSEVAAPAPSESNTVPPSGVTTELPPTLPLPSSANNAAVVDETNIAVSPTATTSDALSKTRNDQILFGEQIDSDKDGVSDNDEITLYRTDPRNPDTDGDGLTDGEEILVWRANPLKPDTDGDGLSDGDEVKLWQTDVLNPDTDTDGFVDGKEVANGYNPKGPGKIEKLPTGMSTSTYEAKYRQK